MDNSSLRAWGRGQLLAGAAIVLAAPALSARAQAAPAPTSDANVAQVETVIVTAERRPEDVQAVPMSVSAFSGHQLEDENITNIADLAQSVPSLIITQANNNRNTTIEIRNTGTSGSNPGIEPDVGLFFDGVYIPAAGPVLNELLDVSTIEVLRGPQGTLYGRNTPVGAVNITTRAPTEQTEGMIDVQYGNYGETRVAGYIGGKIANNLAGRLSLWTDSHSGYEKNIYYNDSVNDSDQYGGRLRLRWTPDSDTTVDLIGYYAVISTTGTVGTPLNPYGVGGIATPGFLAAAAAANPSHPFVATGPFTVDEDDVPDDVTTTWGASITASRVLPFGATLTDILAYNSYDDDIKELSADGLPQDVGHGSQVYTTHTASNELRLVSPGRQFINYVAGIYLLADTAAYDNSELFDAGANRWFGPALGYVTPGDTSKFTFGQTTLAAAAYGQVTANITSDFRMIAGFRYSIDYKKASLSNIDYNITGSAPSAVELYIFPPTDLSNLTRTDMAPTWTGGFQYDLTRELMAYFTTSTGFKDGGFNARAATGGPYTFDPETTINYELGVKSTWFHRRLLLNADIYRMLVHGLQQSTLNPVTGTGFIVGNAGNVRVQGVELDAQATPIDHLSLNGSLSYSNTTYTSYPFGQCISTYPTNTPSSPPPIGSPQPNPVKAGTCNFTGFTPALSPEWKWNIGARWEQPWGQSGFNWFVAGGISYMGSQYMDASLDPRSFQKSYTLLNASIGFEPKGGRWRIDLWGRNLTNKVYYTTEVAEPLGALVSAGGPFAANGFFGWYGQPRTFGVEASYRY